MRGSVFGLCGNGVCVVCGLSVYFVCVCVVRVWWCGGGGGGGVCLVTIINRLIITKVQDEPIYNHN